VASLVGGSHGGRRGLWLQVGAAGRKLCSLRLADNGDVFSAAFPVGDVVLVLSLL
jgi:hypothetical protein